MKICTMVNILKLFEVNQMNKLLVLFALLSVAGCKTLPNFPLFFMSHQDLLDQAESIDTWKDKK